MHGTLCCYPFPTFLALTRRRWMQSLLDSSLFISVTLLAGLLLASLTLLPLRRCGAPG
jgi:hypothetical protein